VRRLIRKALTFALSLALLSCHERQGVGPGDFAYSFALPSILEPSSKIKLASFRGKIVIVNFWASWCGPCLEELPALERLSQRYPEKIAVIGVGIDDDRISLAEAVKKMGVSFPVVLDVNGTLKQRYEVRGVPETFIVGHDGRLALFPDLSGEMTVRLLGPREWDEGYFTDNLLKLMP
jgi:thiol-disulfide isomerase/thioredoxin